MTYSRPSNYPYPWKFKSVEDAEDYAKRMYAALMDNDRSGEFLRDRATDKDLKELVVRPEWYGATGDGTHDDTTAIQAAIDAAIGGTVIFSEKIYAISATLNLKSNSAYIGPRGGSFTPGLEHPTAGYGACLKWIGSNDDIMVQSYGTQHVYWSGIDLDGILYTNGITGIRISSENNPSSQHHHLTDFRIFNVDYGIKVGDYTGGTEYQSDHVLIEHFKIGICNVGIYVNSQNAMDYSTIRNGNIYAAIDCGIYLARCGYLSIEDMTISSYGDSPTTGALIYIAMNNALFIKNVQGEPVSGGTGWYHIKTSTLSTYQPITIISNVVDYDIQINGGRKITSIGNSFESASVDLAGDGIYWLSESDYFTSGDFIYNGGGNCVVQLQKYDTAGAHTALRYLVDGAEQIEIEGYGDFNINGLYKIDGTSVVNQDVTTTSSPRFVAPVADYVYLDGATNSLTDGGLETWASATNLTNWTEYLEGTSTVNREDTTIHGGTYSCRLDIDASDSVAQIYQTVNLVASGKYKMTIWYKTATGKSARFYLNDDDPTGNVWLKSDGTWAISATYVVLPAATSWTEYTLFFTAHASYTAYKFLIERNTAASTSIYLDDLAIVGNDSYGNGVVKINNTQVVGARVVDARLADTPNSGDATTDGLIDALRDLVIAHGLGASS